jgi:hypothetical protein
MAISLRELGMPCGIAAGVAESPRKKSERRCRIGAVLFVVGVRPPTRGGAKGKESRL